MIRPVIYSIGDLLYRVKQVCQLQLGWVAVRGEVSNLRVAFSGHMYFRLKDEQGVIDAVMFRAQREDLLFHPEDGMEVVCWGQCAVYEQQGRLQVVVELMERVGRGPLAFMFERLCQRLEAEGLFASEHKQALPAYPQRIALITSSTGAALQDLLEVLGRRAPSCALVLASCQVQGAGAAEAMAEMLSKVNQRDDIDLIILGRGGGALEDLWPFNEEVLARAIFASRIPVLTGIGHETDTTVADLVADKRAPTPSAAAELAVPEEATLLRRLAQYEVRLHQVIEVQLERTRLRLKSLQERLQPPQMVIVQQRSHVTQWQRRLAQAIQTRLMEEKTRLALAVARLEQLSPRHVLDRGYAWVLDAEGSVVRKGTALAVGEVLVIQLAGRRVRVRVEAIEKGLLDGDVDAESGVGDI